MMGFQLKQITTQKAIWLFLKNLEWPRLLKDTMAGNKWVFSDSWFSGKATAHRWYKKGVNYVTLDGSVQMVKKGPRSEFK